MKLLLRRTSHVILYELCYATHDRTEVLTCVVMATSVVVVLTTVGRLTTVSRCVG